jgi:hypothetical protein
MSGEIEHTIAWRGRSIRLRYQPRWMNSVDHLEIESEDGLPLPVTETGYRSRFFAPVDPPYTVDDLAELVTGWLDEEADTKAWRAAEEKRRQYSLF